MKGENSLPSSDSIDSADGFFMTAAEVACLFNMSQSNLHNWRKKGKGPKSIKVCDEDPILKKRVLYPKKDIKEYLSFLEQTFCPKKAAEFLNVSIFTLNDWRSKKRGPHYVKDGGAIRYCKKDLDDFQKNHFRSGG